MGEVSAQDHGLQGRQEGQIGPSSKRPS